MDHDGRRAPDSGDFSLEPLNIISPVFWDGRPVPSRKWIWEGWIPVGGVTAFYGDGGTGKSLLAQQLMTSCATGGLFLGQGVAHCKVFGMFCEDDEDELHRRQIDLNRALGCSFADLENMQVLSRVGSENLLMTFTADGRGVPTPFFFQILDAVRAFDARLVVIDTAADTFAGNENIRTQVRQFIALLTRLARKIDGAVVLLAHPSQTGKATGSGDGGSTAWNNSVRSRLYFTRPGQPGAKGQDAGEPIDPDLRLLSLLKANYAGAGIDLTVRYVRGAFVDASDEARSIVAGPARDREAEEAFMAGLDELAAKNIRCNTHPNQNNFAPKKLREITTACERFSVAELTAAMNRLIKGNRVASVLAGPKTRERTLLRVVAPDLPGT